LIRDVHIGEPRLKISDGSQWLDAIVFGAGVYGVALERGSIVCLLGQLQLDDYRGNGAIQFVVEDILVGE